MTLDIKSLSADLSFGLIVRGLTMAHLDQPDVQQRLRALWIEKGLIVFKDMEGGADGQVKLSACFGKPEVHPMKHGVNVERPELLDIVYRPGTDRGNIFEVDGRRLGSFLPWHSDLIYVDRINHGGVLRPLEIPPSGTQTGFIDRIAAYETLPQPLKVRIEGLNIVYKLDFDASRQRFGQTHDVRLVRLGTAAIKVMANAHTVPRVLHPAVFQQPETDRKVLNVSPWFAVGIQGMEAAEGDALLEELALHVADESRAYFHDWALGDMVLWDNWRMLHCAPGVPEDQSRSFQRTTIAGDYALGRPETRGADIPDALRINI